MKAASIFLLCILGAALLASVLCEGSTDPNECCFGVFRKRVNKTLIASYHRTDPRCAMRAVVLKTKRRRRICADPSQPWVKNVMNFLDTESF